MSSQHLQSSSDSSVALKKCIQSTRNKLTTRCSVRVLEIINVGDTASDQESTNIKSICPYQIRQKKDICHSYMKGFLKGKSKARASTSSHINIEDDLPAPEENTQSSSRVPKWPEHHNVIFGDILWEQFVQGNICNGVIRRDKWPEVVATLNRKLGTKYTNAIVMTRYKNMKADFRMLYQLTNRSGWGWDETLNIPVAPDEIWEEVIRENFKMRRFRRNPFQQYHIFEKICGDNVATGQKARSTRSNASRGDTETESTYNHETEPVIDNFMSSHGINFVGEAIGQTEDLMTHLDRTNNDQPNPKRSSSDNQQKRRRAKKPAEQDILQNMLTKNVENVDEIRETMNKYCPYTMDDCLTKLSTVPNISTEGLFAVIDAIKDCSDNKVVLMRWEGDMLRSWIEHTVATHPRFYGSSAWL